MNLMHPERRRREAAKRASPKPSKKLKLPRRLVTLELYEDDCKALESQYGDLWRVFIRDWVNQYAQGADRLTVLDELHKDYKNDH